MKRDKLFSFVYVTAIKIDMNNILFMSLVTTLLYACVL